MKLFVFRCSVKPTLTAITIASDGSNLPADPCKGKWVYWKEIEVTLDSPALMGAPTNLDILNAISEKGFKINQAQINFKEREQ